MTTDYVSTQRERRINLRASERQREILHQAAQATDTTMTDFILTSAVTEAERVLADQRWFVATSEQYKEFLELLDQPVDTAKLAAFLSEPSPFGESFELDAE